MEIEDAPDTEPMVITLAPAEVAILTAFPATPTFAMLTVVAPEPAPIATMLVPEELPSVIVPVSAVPPIVIVPVVVLAPTA